MHYSLADEYMQWWTGKDHDRVRLVLWWEKCLGKILLSDITPELIRDALKSKKSQAPATYNKHLAVLSAILDYATLQQEDDSILEQYINDNPCKRVRSLKLDNKIVRYLSDEEKPRLLKAAKDIGGKFYLKVLMALTTGMRKGELERLRWHDIDFDKGLALLSDTKNGTPRHTPIPNVIMDQLKKHREIGNRLLFPSSIDINKPFDYKKQWATCLKTADIKNFRWHDMRHDTASTLARDGWTLKEIAEILGHKSLASTLIIQQIVCDWVRYLKEELLWGNDDPLFPKTQVITGDDRVFKASGFKREHWSATSPIRTIFKDAFELADLPYFNPHSFRKTIVTLGQKLCQTPEEFKSWSQNLGHEDVLTTLYSYGEVQQHRQGEIFQQLKIPRSSANQNVDDIARAVVKAMADQNSQIGV